MIPILPSLAKGTVGQENGLMSDPQYRISHQPMCHTKRFKKKQDRSRGRGRQITSLTYNLSPLPNYNGRTMAIIIDHRYQTREYTRVFRDHKGDLLSPKRGSTIATQLYPSRGKSRGLESKGCVTWTIPEVTPQIWSKSTTRSKHSRQEWKMKCRPA